MQPTRDGQGGEPTVDTVGSVDEIADLKADVAQLRLLVQSLRPKDAPTDGVASLEPEHRPETDKPKRNTRRRILTQLAAGAAGVAAAATYGVTKAGTASAEFYGTANGSSTSRVGIYAYPNSVTLPSLPLIIVTGGVFGQADNNAPNPVVSAGVIGLGNNVSGVFGQSFNRNGLSGRTASASGNDAGVYGFSTNAASMGALGEHLASGGIGVRGISNTGSAAKGVYGTSVSGTGVWGHSTGWVGVKGTSVSSVGLVGISDYSIGLYGYTAAPGQPAFYAENIASSNRIAGWFNGNVTVFGNFQVTGVKNAAVKLADGSEALVYCQESTEPYFEDFGRGQLSGGVARVALEPQFASIVHREGYMVFLTPGGDCNGLFVSRQDANGFEVRELKGGTSAVPFTYRIVAKRKDVPGERLKKVEPHNTTAALANMQKTLRDKGVASMPPAEASGQAENPGRPGAGQPGVGPR